MTTQTRTMLALLLDEGSADEVIDEAVAQIAKADRALALPTLCNRLWFETSGDGYDGRAVSALMAEIPSVANGLRAGHDPLAPQPAVALGAIVEIDLGSDIRYAEVVWKEGAHPALEFDWAPRWLAGAPTLPAAVKAPPGDYAPEEEGRTQRERLAVDFDCFGASLGLSATKFRRLREHAYRVDSYGHLVMDALYEPGLDEDDDVAFWAAWVCRHYPAALAAAGIASDPEALNQGVGSLADALVEHPEIRAFGPYVISAATYERVVEADLADAQCLARTARSLARTPRGETSAWAAMSERLREMCPDAMVGTTWPTTVVVASLFTLDVLAEEAPTGDWNGVHLRLDDPWQGGGLWRAEVLGEFGPVAADPALALGLGWVEHTGGTVERIPGDLLIDAPDWFDGQGDEWSLTGSEACWTLHLTRHDIAIDRLRVPDKVAGVLADTLRALSQSQLALTLYHDGEPDVIFWSTIRDDGHLTMAWPLGILVGTTVMVSWSVGGAVLNLSTRLLPEPVEVGDVIYHHEFNEQVALTALGLAETTAGAVTLSQLVRAAVRRHGDITEDGRRCLSVVDATRRCFGPGGEVAPTFHSDVLRRAVLGAVRRMARTGDACLEGELIVLADTTASGQRADKELLDRYVDKVSQRLRRQMARHWRSANIVNLPAGWKASQEKLDAWAEVAGTDGLPAIELKEGQTWRVGTLVGDELSASLAAELERAKHSAAALGHSPAGGGHGAPSPETDPPTSHAPSGAQDDPITHTEDPRA